MYSPLVIALLMLLGTFCICVIIAVFQACRAAAAKDVIIHQSAAGTYMREHQ